MLGCVVHDQNFLQKKDLVSCRQDNRVSISGCPHSYFGCRGHENCLALFLTQRRSGIYPFSKQPILPDYLHLGGTLHLFLLPEELIPVEVKEDDDH